MKDKFELEALGLLRALTGDAAADFRPDQLDAIHRLVALRERVLLVQRTGWGKSAVYFIATRMLRDRDAGPTLLVSPLLALMRNQIEAAERMEVRAVTINSANRAEWEEVEKKLEEDMVDILLISPERLANQRFRNELLPTIIGRSGLLVIDEAHCISDWGHDFRPDYRRISRVLDFLPGVPLLCCTATANDRVIEDITNQLGSGLRIIRGPLARAGLRLHVLEIPSQAERLTWLADLLSKVEGTGVIYCLTVRDAQRVAEWLTSVGTQAVPYWGGLDSDDRIETEQALLSNGIKVVVATSALGMGFDKPDLSFVIHYQAPGSPIAYYQQVGRAGRELDRSWGVLLSGREDADIQDYFIHSAFPPARLAERVVSLLERRAEPVPRDVLFQWVNVRAGQLENLLKNLEVEGAIEREGNGWRRTLQPWTFDRNRVESVTAQRRTEQTQMLEYIRANGCRMRLLGSYLDDADPEPCGMCDNCTGQSLVTRFDPAIVQRAVEHLRRVELTIGPRKQWPDRKRIPEDLGLEQGRVLAVWGDSGWGTLVRSGKLEEGRFSEQLVAAAAELICARWTPEPPPTWVTSVPSLRIPNLVQDFAARLAESIRLPYKNVVEKVRDTEQQKFMQNSHQQYRNVRDAFEIQPPVPLGPVLLVDDIVDSKWTLTVVGGKLRDAGAGLVYPFALADAAGRTLS
ncbi:MAG: RecQ family ATP-dependent DNA helicase [bacterium]|nr:RecQ family ATP-dependent DNA helicase [bacterium]MDE0602526.1 RecQ family ATP-dependent DNA helicase [bacterium]